MSLRCSEVGMLAKQPQGLSVDLLESLKVVIAKITAHNVNVFYGDKQAGMLK